MIVGLHHASITTPDLDRLVAFYRDQMGFSVALETEWDAGNTTADRIFGLADTAVRMAMLRTSNAFLELFEFRHPVGRPADDARQVCDQAITHICLQVTDLASEYARLSAVGMRFHSEPQDVPGLCKAVYGRDPDGNIVELVEADPNGPFALDQG